MPHELPAFVQAPSTSFAGSSQKNARRTPICAIFRRLGVDLDTTRLQAMGCEYVISAAYIENSIEHGLRLEREFVISDFFWHLYLYQVISAGYPNGALSCHGGS